MKRRKGPKPPPFNLDEELALLRRESAKRLSVAEGEFSYIDSACIARERQLIKRAK